ncbi:hypothetical protein HII12_002309 [Brettanomyces bruxellensis]|uniref:BSD domain-containing protein n=1 Tax=Dekkera bruxellensis TaxID=5007 RepID=A0A8H6EWK6_DEKBR|nr:hypothetical protein HII12_002309 [Brettanomyces bruxellensis]
MPATVSGTAFHHRKAGIVTILEDAEPPKVVWKCVDTDASHSVVSIPLDKIMMLKIGLKDEHGSESDGKRQKKHKNSVIFSFNNRVTMDNIKLTLQQVIARKKTSKEMEASRSETPDNEFGTSEYGENVDNDELLTNLLDSKKLLKNFTLQQKLLRENSDLMKTFTEAVIKSGLEPEEFWSSRIHLLRSYAVQHSQKRGPYNVLSTIKPVASSENEVNVSVTREKIHEIFKQYPIVRKAYDDNINLYDRGDITLDKYLYYDPDYDGEEEDEDVDKLLEDQEAKETDRHKEKGRSKKRRASDLQITAAKKKVKLFNGEDEKISKCIDILGNEADDAGLLGNKPDITMKKDQDPDLVNIMRTMNRLSRRMMSNIKENPRKKNSNPDDEFKHELEIKDLDHKETVDYNKLNYTQRSNVSSSIVPPELVKQAMTQSDLNPKLNDYDASMQMFKGQFNEAEKLDLTSVYFQIKKSIYDSYKDVISIVRKNSKQSSQSWSLDNDNLSTGWKDARSEISKDRLESLRLTQSTSIEFLRHFWIHFNSISTSSISTNSHFKKELIQLRKSFFSITKCLERVTANLNQSEGEERTKEEEIMHPLIESLKRALQKYEDAIIEPKR